MLQLKCEMSVFINDTQRRRKAEGWLCVLSGWLRALLLEQA